jgi:hypothetical protein
MPQVLENIGAGEGNRTLVISLEDFARGLSRPNTPPQKNRGKCPSGADFCERVGYC